MKRIPGKAKGYWGLWGGMESFTFRMFKIFFAFALVVSVVVTLLSVNYQVAKVHDDLRAKGKTIVSLLAQSVRVGVFAENRDLLTDAVEGVMSQAEVQSVVIYASDGRELLRRDRDGKKPSGTAEALQKGEVSGPTDRGFGMGGAGALEFIEPVIIGSSRNSEESLYFGETAGKREKTIIGRVRVVLDSSSLDSRTDSIIAQNLAIACFFLLIGTMFIGFTLRRVLKPLTLLTDEVRMFGEGRAIEKISVSTDDEIGRLAAAFNEMAENLKKRDEEARVLEMQLRHAQKMEAVGTLARGIAHDFNNILTTVQASIYALQKKIDEHHHLYNYVFHMNNSVSRAKVLIQSLLIFSRGQVPRPFPVELNGTIAKMMPMITGLMGDDVECRPVLCERPLVVMADAVQMEQVLMNLASNARDAMPGGGTFSIKTDEVDVQSDEMTGPSKPGPGRYALISVADSGQGISNEIRERIFEPFFTTKEVGKGTGLGLSIVYGIIEQHNGHILVSSGSSGTAGGGLEKGAEFRIYLPLFEKRDEMVQDTTTEDANG